MVNKQIQTEINDLKLKETRIQLNRSLDKQQLNSIENRNPIDLNNNELIQIKKIKLNDDLKYYDFLDTTKDLDNRDLLDGSNNGQINNSVLSSYLSNCQTQQLNDITNENQYLNSSINTSTNLGDNVLIDEFENSIEINDLNNLHLITSTKNQQTNSQLNDNTFNQSTNLQFNDPFLPLPYNHQFTNTNESNSTNLNNLTTNTNQSSTKLLLTNHNSPSQFIKLDQENDEQIKCDDQLNNSTFNHSLSLNNTNAMNLTLDDKRLLSSQKINGEDLLFGFANDDLNDVANNLFPTTNSNNFNYSPSLDSINSGDSMFCSSELWGSSPNSNSSNNSSLNNDLDLPFIMNSDSTDLSSSNQPSDQCFLDSEFPFLMSEDSIFNSFLNSNLSDLINTDEFFNEKCTLNDDLQIDNNLNSFLNYSNTFNSSFNDNYCSLNSFNQNRLFRKNFTLSKDSNLAKLLKEKLPIKLPSQSNQSLNNGNINSNDNCLKLVDNQINNKQNNQTNLKTTTTIKTEPIIKSVNNIANTNSQIDLKKNGLITRKLQGFTIQGLNVDGKTTNLSTGCLARSIKIIDPMNVQVNGNSNNVKYLLNNISTTANSNNQTTSTTNCFSLNLTPANCITVTNSINPTNLTVNNQSALSTSTTTSIPNQLSTNQTPQTATLQSNTTTKSFIIKSVDGKFANGILYTPISSKNGTNIAYTSNLTNCTTNGLLINNRKLVQKRPYSSMSVSISNQNLNTTQTLNTATGTKDFYSIDLVPNTINTVNSTISSNLTIDNNELETNKKLKTLDTSTDKSNYTSKLPTNSVLLNLLVKGEDISNGYLKSNYTYKRCNQSIYNKSQQSTRIR